MPFDPEEAAKKLGLQSDIQAPGSSAKFDPEKAAQSLGLATPQQPPPSGASIPESIGRAASQGGTFGFGDEASGGVQAAMGAADSLVNGSNNFGDQGRLSGITNFTDNYAKSRDMLKAQNEIASEAHPVVSALSEIVSSLPLSVITAGSNLIKTAATQGAAYGLGKSNKDSLAQALKDSAVSGGISALVAGSIGKLGKALKDSAAEAGVDFNSAFTEFGDAIKASTPLRVAKKGDDILKISYSQGSKQAFELGQEMQAALSNPEVKAQITDDLNAQPKGLQQTFDQIRSKINPQYDETVAQYAKVPSDLTSVFDKARKSANSIFDKSDISVEKAKTALIDVLDNKEKDLVSKYGSLKEVPLDELAATKQDIGNLVFKQKAFKKAGTDSVHNSAVRFWGDLTDTLGATDVKSGSGGKLANIDKVNRAIYNMESDLPSGANLLSLSNPKAANARDSFNEFLTHWAKVPADTRQLYGQELTDYLKGPMSKAISKGQLMQAVDQGSAPGLKALGIYLPGRSGRMNYANKLGAFVGPSGPASTGSSLPNLSGIRQAAAPALGALQVDQSQPSGQGALQEIK